MLANQDRRDFLKAASGLGIASLFAGYGCSLDPLFGTLTLRPIPGTGESLPAIGFGSTKAVRQILEQGPGQLTALIEQLVKLGGTVIDSSPREVSIDEAFGKVLMDDRWRDKLFISTKINTLGKQAGINDMRHSQKLFGKKPADLVQVESMIDLETHWQSLREWKDQGETRYIGITTSRNDDHGRMQAFMEKEPVDFIQVNYSLGESNADQHLFPLAEERGIAVLINSPFMNGDLFDRVNGKVLPEWAREELDCESWAQFALKYILSNKAVTCVLTETSSAEHLEENIRAGFGDLPDATMHKKMKEHYDSLVQG